MGLADAAARDDWLAVQKFGNIVRKTRMIGVRPSNQVKVEIMDGLHDLGGAGFGRVKYPSAPK